MNDKSEGIGSKLFGVLFQKSEEEATAEPAPKPTPNLFGANKPAPKPTMVAPTQVSSGGQIDPTIQKILEADINEAAKPAYTQFMATEQSLHGVIPDERTRMKAAMATIGVQGHSQDKVLVDIDECLEALERKVKENEVASKAARDRKIGGLKSELQKANNELEKLEAQLAAQRARVTELEASVATEEEQISRTEANFVATAESYRERLCEAKEKIGALG